MHVLQTRVYLKLTITTSDATSVEEPSNKPWITLASKLLTTSK